MLGSLVNDPNFAVGAHNAVLQLVAAFIGGSIKGLLDDRPVVGVHKAMNELFVRKPSITRLQPEQSQPRVGIFRNSVAPAGGFVRSPPIPLADLRRSLPPPLQLLHFYIRCLENALQAVLLGDISGDGIHQAGKRGGLPSERAPRAIFV